MAFSAANKQDLPKRAPARAGFEYLNEGLLDPVFLAAVEAVEEAVINALIAAESMSTVKPPGLICRAIDHDALCAVMRDYGWLR